MPPSLAELQRGLAARILSGNEPAIERWVAVPDDLHEAAVRVGVHTDGYPARIGEALREAFPAIAHLLGSTRFAELARRFAFDAGPTPANLNSVGEGLGDFLVDDPLQTDLPFLADLARLEWAVVASFHAAVDPHFDPTGCESWTAEDWASLRLRFQPGTALVCSPFPIHALRDTRDVPRDEIDVDLVARPESVLVYRQGFDVATDSVDEEEATAFVSLAAGEPLGGAITALAALGAEPTRVSELFARWAGLGLLSAGSPGSGAL